MVATEDGEILQVPLNVISLRSVVEPFAQPASVPLLAARIGFTVTTVEVTQLVGSVYITDTDPDDKPLNSPVAAFIVAVPAGTVLQVPDRLGSDMSIPELTQTSDGPVIGEGIGFTVTPNVSKQPVPNE